MMRETRSTNGGNRVSVKAKRWWKVAFVAFMIIVLADCEWN